MREKYYEFLNMAVVDTSPIKNSDFLRSVAIEVIFSLLIFIGSFFIKEESHDMSMIVFRFTIYHIVLLVFIFLLFQKFSKTKILQLVPASSVLISHVELLFGSSIFLGDDYWSIFMKLIGLSLIFQLLTFIYQLLIVPKAKTLPSGEFRKTILHIPPLIVASLAAILAIIARLFMLPVEYIATSIVGLGISCLPLYWLEYARVFNGWKKKSTKNFIYRGEIK
ncbi:MULTISPECIES: lantibiotic ABC transporter permease [Streptococcus mitis group]|uniref:lantibiotic ABC transporter permease n=1 Tax=Streptococcus mitis group TaxID=3409772 RepID=UPI0021B57716|nr:MULTISPECIES: lantibiotic ABC transporter permease [Streptococcus]MDB0074629.1 lantibiotic ABC transporter permease [Streptococcus gwangjuense]